LAKLAREMSEEKSLTIYHLAKRWQTDVMGVWRHICHKAGQPSCTLPIELMSSHRRDVVREPQRAV
jgi:hypothetical protein